MRSNRRIALILALAGAVSAGAACACDLNAQTSPQPGFAALRADGNGVPALRKTVALQPGRAPLGDVLSMIMGAADLALVYPADLPGLDRLVTIDEAHISAAEALLRVLAGSGLGVLVSSGGQAVVVRVNAPREDGMGAVSGLVRELETGVPIAHADVEIAGTAKRVLSDARGRFRLRDVPTGAHTVTVSRIGYHAATPAVVQVGAAGADDVIFEMTPAPTPLAAVMVSPGHFGMLEQGVGARQSLARDEIEAQPQLGDDIFRAVNRIPGVSSQDYSAAFGVRGGEHRELLVRLDGLELIEPFHLKDFDDSISIIDLGSIGGIDLITGGFGAEYGNRLSGVFDMRSVAVPPGGARTSLGLSLTNVRAASQGSFASDRGRWLFTARRGYLDLALALSNGNTELSPRYYDVLGKVEYQLTPRTVLSAHVLHAGDRLSFEDPPDPDLESSYGSSYAWLNLEARPADRLSVFTVASLGRLGWKRTGARPSNQNFYQAALAVDDDRSFRFVGLRQEWTLELSDRALLKAGFDARSASADYDYLSWTEAFSVEDGQVITRRDTSRAATAPEGTSVAGYIAQRLRPWAPLTLEVGGEWSHHSHTGVGHVNPRVNLALSRGRSTLRGAWGRYSQVHGLHELQVQDGSTVFSPAERAEHRVVSFEHSVPGALDVRVEAYERRTSDVRPRFVNLDNVDDLLPEVTQSRHRIDPQEARARGLELTARGSGSRFDWAASYALATARERIDGAWSPAPRDQRHSFGIDLSYSPNPRWRLAAAWQIRSGWPYTPQVVTAEPVTNGWFFAWDYGEYNSRRLADYHRMDLRLSRQFDTRRGRVSVFLDLWNVYNHGNARAVYRNVIDVRNGTPVTSEEVDELLPRLPSIGIYWEF
jgi:hypothetical protein